MACSDDRSRPIIVDNNASIALLRRLRAGGGHDDDVHFVHRVDVCAAPPEVLTAGLEPVPGTGGLDDDGYGRIWYLYHAKKFTNSRGKLSGHRQRAVTGGGTSWHKEIACRDVQGSGGGTFCTFSYGIKKKEGSGSARSIDRLGWCMVEYDTVAADEQQQDEAAAAAASNYVLCKVYRSPRAKGKSASASASASSSSKKQTAKKRKAAGGGDHPEAPPAKSIQQQEPQETAYCYQPEVDVQQRPEPAGGPGADSEHWYGGVNFNIEDFNVENIKDILEMLRDEPEPEPEPGQLQHPAIAEPEHNEHDGRFIQLPCGPVLAAEATAGDTTTYGHGSCSSYAPSWLYTGTAGCSSGLLQVQGSPVYHPYLTC